jgi:uncharacterized membrane protein
MLNFSFNFEDASQIFVGAFALAVPISFTQDAWLLGETLPIANLMMLIVLSLLFLSGYTYESVFQRNIKGRVWLFTARIIIAYLITVMVVALTLFCINKLPLFDDPITALRRIIVIAMPASMGAIIVDSFDKE